MNWNDIGNAISKYAPLAGAALTSPVGAVIGIGTVIANLFGVKADPESVMEFIENNPDKAQERLQFEMANNIELQKLINESLEKKYQYEVNIKTLEFQNTDSARKNSSNINGSPVDNNIKLILVMGMFLLLLICISSYIVYHNEMNQTVIVSLGAIMGSLMTSLASMVNFYWGTSFSSQKKDDIIFNKR